MDKENGAGTGAIDWTKFGDPPPEIKGTSLDWPAEIPGTEPEGGCALFEKYNPNDFMGDQPAPEWKGPSTWPAHPHQPAQTAGSLRRGIGIVVAGVLFAFSQCSAGAEPLDKTPCAEKSKAKAAGMCLDMHGCTGGLQEAINAELLKACLEIPEDK